VKAAGPRARLGQDAPDHPPGRDQIGKLELDVHQLFTHVLGLPSNLVAALPDPGEHPAHRSVRIVKWMGDTVPWVGEDRAGPTLPPAPFMPEDVLVTLTEGT
jgi:hypothetical protein